ncbi:uncharacterized protein MEPE_01813 [Melanopsichium pennsylvanicum]|uniref:DFDF domain-containing protein n=2 Tax=Melanopsichium pennsylvanicum TaxID=63383 RepID=A0AAJ4XIP2_9BASI|nr:putative protein [Melanopsichium pennsylvanicum 4]SNX83107.1 uncharacterized protein MEPE_01813 [Melanopsichium pennsylvanicum]
MSSQFIGLNVKLTLHSQPASSIQAKILAIDQPTNTLTVQKQDGSHAVLNRSHIASIATSKPLEKVPSSATPSRSDTFTPSKSQSKPKRQQESLPVKYAASPAFVDPAIVPHSHLQGSSTEQHHSYHFSAQIQAQDPTGSRSSTPSRSPRPKPAAAQTPKSAKKKQTPISRDDSPVIDNAPLSEDFDFSAGLKAFDKKKIWDDIRASDHTDPASLLVSHNRIVNRPTALVRGPNGVGPANSVPTPDRGRVSVKDGQQKMRPNEMVCSPSPERVPSPSRTPPLAVKAEQPQSVVAQVEPSYSPKPAGNKLTCEQLEEKIRKLEAELALARRRNKLLEELAGLGLGVSSHVGDTPDHKSPNLGVASPTQPGTRSDAHAQSDPAIADTTNEPSALSLQTGTSKIAAGGQETGSAIPTGLSSALAVAGFSVSSRENSTLSTPAPGTPATINAAPATELKEAAKQEPVFGHIVSPPVLTLLFPTAALQHAALARIEAFYESDTAGKRYLTLQQAADERICRNYQGFNFPLRQGVNDWLDDMCEATKGDDEAKSPKWWEQHCNAEEIQLLDVLVELGAVSPYEGASSRNLDAEEDGRVTYVISCVASQAHSTLPHELLHALYFLSPTYRMFVSQQYASLSGANKKVIETDLGLRKYSPSVFEDEFQAYMAEGLGTEKEFGNKPSAECREIAEALRSHVSKEWKELGLDLEDGKQQDKWEEVKWLTLDRYAAVQKTNKKNNKATAGASPAKAKGGKKIKK